jgi:hypothetical protein
MLVCGPSLLLILAPNSLVSANKELYFLSIVGGARTVRDWNRVDFIVVCRCRMIEESVVLCYMESLTFPRLLTDPL